MWKYIFYLPYKEASQSKKTLNFLVKSYSEKEYPKWCQQEHYICSFDGKENEDLPCSRVEGYQCFRRRNYLHLQVEDCSLCGTMYQFF
jgi:hypothetical protein